MVNKKKLIVVSGHFNPLHVGHLDMIEHAGTMGEVLVIVNNDAQQLLKKGKIIIPQDERLRIVESLEATCYSLLALDEGAPVIETIRKVAEMFSETHEIIFANGGDRDAPAVVPESSVCEELGIAMVYGIGGTDKTTSSTRINKRLGLQ